MIMMQEKDKVNVRIFSAPGVPGLENRTFVCSTKDLST